MKIHDIYEVAYSVKLAGLSNENQLVRTFFMRSGKRLPFIKILELYQEILRVVHSLGYSDVFDFLKDFFPEEDFERIRISKKNLDVKLLVNSTALNVPTESVVASPMPGVFQPEQEEPVSVPVAVEKGEIVNKEVVLKPIKVFKDTLNTEPLPFEITPKDKLRVNKFKRISKKFREMDVREKEVDNKYDYFMHRSKIDESVRAELDNRELLEENPFMGTFYGDLDLEFRGIMYKIYKYNKNKIKDKTQYADEMAFLEKYFAKKLHMGKKDDGSVQKLSNAIAYLMKKLQNKIFETDDPEVMESMLYFKTKLYLFYNYYRK